MSSLSLILPRYWFQYFKFYICDNVLCDLVVITTLHSVVIDVVYSWLRCLGFHIWEYICHFPVYAIGRLNVCMWPGRCSSS